MNQKTNNLQDFKNDLTKKMITLFEKEGDNWKKHIKASPPRNAIKKNIYNGSNYLQLQLDIMLNRYKNNCWLTFQQAKKLGGNVIKGEKSRKIIFFSNIPDKKEKNKTIPIVKFYHVFNAEQCENLEMNHETEILNDDFNNIKADEVIKKLNADIKHSRNSRAFYNVIDDNISVPPKEDFINNSQNYYAIVFHELGHWTGSKERLNREFFVKKNVIIFKKDIKNEAFEELIAELTALYCCSYFGIKGEELDKNHASYLKSWVRIAKEDNNFIYKAAVEAGKAFDFIIGNNYKDSV